MPMFDSLRAKLRNTNDALAGAHKAWRDERLDARDLKASERERQLADRESAIAVRLAEIRAIEGRRWRRRLGVAVLVMLTGAICFVVGFALGHSSFASADATQSTTLAKSTDAGTRAASEQVAVDQGEVATDVESNLREAPSVGACRQKGIAYFKSIGSYPTLNYPPDAGRSADLVAMERCTRSPYAFGGND
jgi:hypothetical protein